MPAIGGIAATASRQDVRATALLMPEAMPAWSTGADGQHGRRQRRDQDGQPDAEHDAAAHDLEPEVRRRSSTRR